MDRSDARIAAILHAAYPEIDSDDPVSYFGRVGDVFGALSYAWLFWPRLIEIEGAVFLGLDGNDQADISARLRTPAPEQGPRWPPLAWTDAVDSFNTFEVEQLFRRWREPAEFVAQAREGLAGMLVEIWQARLVSAYPRRTFTVETCDADESWGLSIQVRQSSPPLITPRAWDEERRHLVC